MKSGHSQNEKRQIPRIQMGVGKPAAPQQMMLGVIPAVDQRFTMMIPF
jgi:hypothetical protein